jgi:BirA family biotin operon repressor/biotin-[acetyl-CoA-carboxylase] ligase
LKSSRSELSQAIDSVRDRLHGLASSVHFLPTTGSTNDVAMALAARDAYGAIGAVVVAGQQTAGRGRRGHTWFSPPESGLYVSVVLAPSRARVDPGRATRLLTLAVGVALSEGIEASAGLRADLKWPNDLYVARRKLAGILAEASGHPTDPVVVGYGINIAATAYPPDLRDRATSLESELERPIDRFVVFAETLAAVACRYRDLLDGQFDVILDAWRSRAPGAAGARVSWIDAAKSHAGITAGIDEDGALLVRRDGRIDRIVAGELTWLSGGAEPPERA